MKKELISTLPIPIIHTAPFWDVLTNWPVVKIISHMLSVLQVSQISFPQEVEKIYDHVDLGLFNHALDRKGFNTR